MHQNFLQNFACEKRIQISRTFHYSWVENYHQTTFKTDASLSRYVCAANTKLSNTATPSGPRPVVSTLIYTISSSLYFLLPLRTTQTVFFSQKPLWRLFTLEVKKGRRLTLKPPMMQTIRLDLFLTLCSEHF